DIRAYDGAEHPQGPPAVAALWIEELPDGLALRIADLATGMVLVAETIHNGQSTMPAAVHGYNVARLSDARARGTLIKHSVFDVAFYPQPHMAWSWLEQWGDYNQHLSGIGVSLVNPVLG